MVVMGVAGCGKSSVGKTLARRLGAVYKDGDDLHPRANTDKMRSGIALGDVDRWSWLESVGQSLTPPDGRMIMGCSALRRSYREHIAKAAGAPLLFIHLAGSRALIDQRMLARIGHFMPASLLASQFAALEPPAPDESAISVDIAQPLEVVVTEVLSQIRSSTP